MNTTLNEGLKTTINDRLKTTINDRLNTTLNECLNMYECRVSQCYRARWSNGYAKGWCYLMDAVGDGARCAGDSSDPTVFGGEIIARSDYCYVRSLLLLIDLLIFSSYSYLTLLRK